MTEGGLAKTTKAIQVGDELVEVEGRSVKGLQLAQAVPLLHNAGAVVRLKLLRLITIPERDFHSKGFRSPPPLQRPAGSTVVGQPIYAALTHRPPPPPSSCQQQQQPLYSPLGSPMSNYRLCSKVSFRGETDLPTVTLLPR